MIDITYPAAWGSAGVEACLAGLCAQAVDAIKLGHTILILSDEAGLGRTAWRFPALLGDLGPSSAPDRRGPAHDDGPRGELRAPRLKRTTSRSS